MTVKNKFQALGDVIIVDAMPIEEQKTDKGLAIPKSAQKPVHMGKVISIGENVDQVSPGDKVAFKGIRSEYNIQGERLLAVEQASLVYLEDEV